MNDDQLPLFDRIFAMAKAHSGRRGRIIVDRNEVVRIQMDAISADIYAADPFCVRGQVAGACRMLLHPRPNHFVRVHDVEVEVREYVPGLIRYEGERDPLIFGASA